MPTYRKATNQAGIDYQKPWAGIVHWQNVRYFLGSYCTAEEAEIGEIDFKIGMLEDRQKELRIILRARSNGK